MLVKYNKGMPYYSKITEDRFSKKKKRKSIKNVSSLWIYRFDFLQICYL